MKKLSNLIKFSSNRKLGFRVQLFGRDFFPWIKNQGLGQMTRFLYFSLDFCHFFIKIMCFSSNFCPCSSFAGVQGLAFLSSSFRGLAFRSSISASINVLKKMSKKLKKSSKNGGTALILVFGTVLFLVFLRCMQDYYIFIKSSSNFCGPASIFHGLHNTTGEPPSERVWFTMIHVQERVF